MLRNACSWNPASVCQAYSTWVRMPASPRRTLYKQFASKEEIFRKMLLRLTAQLETVFSAWHETHGDVEDALRLIAGAEARGFFNR